jgi:hypothetical protein
MLIQHPVEYSTSEEMDSFESFIDKLHKKYSHLGVGAVKIIPPQEWLSRMACSFDTCQIMFGKKMVQPKIQLVQKLVDGIYRLTLNPVSDRPHLDIANPMKNCNLEEKDSIFFKVI